MADYYFAVGPFNNIERVGGSDRAFLYHMAGDKEMSETKYGWGGRRPNQTGRPKQDRVRTQHQLRAFPEEWEMIRAFAAILKKDPERAARMMAVE